MRPRFVCARLAAIGALIFVSPVAAQSSAHYVMKRITPSSGAQVSTSPHRKNSIVAGSVSPPGAESFCNTGYVNSLGFWSVQGALPVPIQLNAKRNTLDPTGSVDLMWSGADALYRVYRAFSPQNLLDPANIDRETPACDGTDTRGYQSNIIFYTVVRKP
jgi:hypothetical protein